MRARGQPLTRILYWGTSMSGRETSLQQIVPLAPGEPRPAWYQRMSAGVVVGGRAVRIDVNQYRALWYPTLQDAAASPYEHVREIAERAVAALPEIEGIVFVIDARRPEASHEQLDSLRQSFARAGVDADRIPIAVRVCDPARAVVRREHARVDAGTLFVMFGELALVAATEQSAIPDDAYLRVHRHHVDVMSRGRFLLANAATYNVTHFWRGFDATGMIVELSVYGDVGAAVLERFP